MKVGLYAGSFNPFHRGHLDIVTKALKVVDFLDIVVMTNPNKLVNTDKSIESIHKLIPLELVYGRKIKTHSGLLVDYVKENRIDVIVRGLRNGSDLEYEQSMQYWNEDLGLKIPVIYFICNRSLGHISSSAIRQIEGFQQTKSLYWGILKKGDTDIVLNFKITDPIVVLRNREETQGFIIRYFKTVDAISFNHASNCDDHIIIMSKYDYDHEGIKNETRQLT